MVMQPEELKVLRGSAGLTQGALAEAIGMTRQSIGEMEAGRAPIEKRTDLAVRYVVEALIRGRVAGMERAADQVERVKSATSVDMSGLVPGGKLPAPIDWDALFRILDLRYARL